MTRRALRASEPVPRNQFDPAGYAGWSRSGCMGIAEDGGGRVSVFCCSSAVYADGAVALDERGDGQH